VGFESRTENRSWSTVDSEVALDRHGNDVLVVIARLAYEVSFDGATNVAFRPVRWRDVGDGERGLKFPCDLVDHKPGTDVALVGTAHPTNGKPVERQLAWVSAGSVRKVINVHGPRKFVADGKAVVPGPAAPLQSTPLRHEGCFGGTEGADAETKREWHNPVGRGFATDPATLLGRPAPCLEPVADPGAGSTPHASRGCFAPLMQDWLPRAKLAGTYDDEWVRSRSPIYPRDFDPMHHSWAPAELHAKQPLEPDMEFEIGGVLAEGTWRFRLPKYAMAFWSRLAGERREHRTHLDSVIIDADERVVELTWRAAILLPRKWERLEHIHASGVGTMPQDALVEKRGGQQWTSL